MKKDRIKRAMGLMITAALLLSGCGSGKQAKIETQEPSAAASAETAAVQEYDAGQAQEAEENGTGTVTIGNGQTKLAAIPPL